MLKQETGWSLMIFCARATRGLRRVGGEWPRLPFLLAERARWSCARPMRAVKAALATPLNGGLANW